MVKSLVDFALNKEYKQVQRLGDKLNDINTHLDWDKFRPIIKEIYKNDGPEGGRKNIDEIVMLKLVLLQEWYGLSDPELERQVTDRISFRHFLGYPDIIPDYSTVWYFRERLSKTGKDKDIWNELQMQLELKGISIKKGVIQDATFITADPGHAKLDKPRGKNAKTRRNKDGTWVKKGKKNFFGYKLHSKQDIKYGLIREVQITNNRVHDSQIDLSKKGEVIYRDRGYFGADCNGFNATMNRATRDHPLGIRDTLRNKRICRKRAPGERPYAVIKNVFKSGHIKVTTTARVTVKMIFTCFCFNLYQLNTIKKYNMV